MTIAPLWCSTSMSTNRKSNHCPLLAAKVRNWVFAIIPVNQRSAGFVAR
jgi:hypothetical protein